MLTPLIFDVLHYPFFTFISAILFSHLKHVNKIALILLLAIGIIEILQPIVGRSSGYQDAIWGWLGLLTAYCWWLDSRFFKRVLCAAILSLYCSWASYKLYFPINHLISAKLVHNFEHRGDEFGWRNVNHDTEVLSLEYSKELNSRVLKGYKLDGLWTGVAFDFVKPALIKDKTHLTFDFYIEQDCKVLDVKLSFVGEIPQFQSVIWLKKGLNKLNIKILSDKALKQISIYYETKKGSDWYLIDNLTIE